MSRHWQCGVRWASRLATVSLTLTLPACAAAPPGGPPPGVGVPHVIDVPFVSQSAYDCGPAALAMVLRHHGRTGPTADPDEIARAVRLPSGQGALNLELEFQARRLGFRTRAFAGTLEGLRRQLSRDHPVIVLQDLGWPPILSRPHFAVAIGFDDAAGTLVLHSGTTAYLRMPYAEFDRSWAREGRWALLVLPPEADREP